jgi:hypothetical protein
MAKAVKRHINALDRMPCSLTFDYGLTSQLDVTVDRQKQNVSAIF